MTLNKTFILYLVSNKTNGKLYIGWTGDIAEQRWNEHCSSAKYGSKYYFHNAIRKYTRDGFDWNVMKSFTSDNEAKEEEKKCIAIYKEFGYTLYNMTDGGEGITGYKFSEESKQKMSKSHIGLQSGENSPNFGTSLSEETKRKIGLKNKGRALSEEQKQNISNGQTGEKHHRFGKHLTEDHKQKLSENTKGKHNSPNTEFKKGENIGENNAMALIKNYQSLEIRNKWATTNYTVAHLADEYNVSKGTIRAIINNITWKISEEEHLKFKEIRKQKLLDINIAIKNKYNTGNYTQKQLAIEYNLGETTINKIIYNK